MDPSLPLGTLPVNLEDGLETFANELGLPLQGLGFLRDLPAEVKESIIGNFDPSGTKDGNVLGRLQAYAKHMVKRHGLQPLASLNGSAVRRSPREGASVIQQPAVFPFFEDKPSETALQAGGEEQHPEVGIASYAISAFVERLGLTEAMATFLTRLPEDLQSQIVQGFDPSGTKDGNIWGRLLGFTRGRWSRRLNLNEQASTFLRGLPEELQLTVMMDFDASGSKDGNVSARLMQFASYIVARGSAAKLAVSVCQSNSTSREFAIPEGSQIHAHHEQTHTSLLQQEAYAPNFGELASHGTSTPSDIQQFSIAWGLDERAVSLMHHLPEPIRDHVLQGFDGSGTKDGNVWGRLLGFSRHIWAKYIGLDQDSVAFVKSLPEEAQVICLTDFDPSGTKDGNIAGRLQGFSKKALAQANQSLKLGGDGMNALHAASGIADAAHMTHGVHTTKRSLGSDSALRGFLDRCSLDWSAMPFLEGLPQDVLETVVHEFDPSGTKDGNVFGRLQGYVRFLTSRRKRSAEDCLAGSNKRVRDDGY